MEHQTLHCRILYPLYHLATVGGHVSCVERRYMRHLCRYWSTSNMDAVLQSVSEVLTRVKYKPTICY